MKTIKTIFTIFSFVLFFQSLQAQMFWNHAAKFDGGTASYIACANTVAINIVGSVTMEAWVYPTTSTGIRYIIFKGSAGAGYYLRLNSNGTLSMGTNGVTRVTSTLSVPSGKWTHVAGTYNHNTDLFTVYINGLEDGIIMSDNPPATSTDSLLIGKFGANSFTGLIDEVRIWTKEVSQNDVRRNMRSSLTLSSGKYTSLLFSMPFQRPNSAGTVFTLTDLSLNPISITVGHNRGITSVNLGNQPSDYLSCNEALDLEGNFDSYAAIASNGLNNITGAMTLEAWINIAAPSAVTQYIFHKHGASTGYRIFVSNTQKLTFSINASQFYEGSTNIVSGRWYHVAWVITASGASSLYINGVLEAYFASVGTPLSNNDSLYIGRGFNGLIDEARVFKYERTAADIKKFANVSIDESNVPPGESFSFNLDGSAWANTGFQILYLRGNTYFSAPSSLSRSSSPLVRANGYNFQDGFYKTIRYRRIPESGSMGDMIDDTIFIPDNVTINDLNVYVGLNHGNEKEIQISLVSPTGQEIMLMNNFELGGTSSTVATIFDDQADSSMIDNHWMTLSPKIKPQQGSLNSTFQGVSSQGMWRLKIKDLGGVSGGALSSWGIQINNSPAIGIQNISSEIPANYSLGQNYPNPFNPMTNIKIQISKQGPVKLAVYDITGKEVSLLVKQTLSAGTYNVDFDGSNLSSGTYFYRLESGGFTEVKKMILVK